MYRAYRLSLLSICSLLLFVSAVLAQSSIPAARITSAVDERALVRLPGNTHPLARKEFDRGALPDDTVMGRMLLVLKRSSEQEHDLTGLLDQQQDKRSAHFHQWLTPEQFGQSFGIADADLAVVTSWLASHGFKDIKPSKGRTVIEFSGVAGQVREAFHTQMHRYEVKNEMHVANDRDPQIPAALSPVVAGFSGLHNFFPKPQHTSRHAPKLNSTYTGPDQPYVFPGLYGCGIYGGFQQTICGQVGAYDFDIIYNVVPAWTAGITGKGVTLAIVSPVNVHISDAVDFQNYFGLPNNPPTVVLDGPDPGVGNPDGYEVEAALDMEWVGAASTEANVIVMVAGSDLATFGTDLAALHIINNNTADIFSVSYGGCELFQGAGGNLFHEQLWQQAAAEGITVVMAAGDSGSANCDNGEYAQYGLAVSGMASTPYNVAVGGTDFSDLTAAETALYWSTTNNPTTQASALSYIPEVPWDNSCTNPETFYFSGATDGLTNCNSPNQNPYVWLDISGGGGGQSNCISSSDGTVAGCTGGWPKPSWQSGPGVPSDGVRDLPDVSLFAANFSISGSGLLNCQADLFTSGTSCDPSDPNTNITGGGGTSYSAPAFASILGLVAQKAGGRLGNANYVLYKLAAQSGNSCDSSTVNVTNNTCSFYDITSGNNSGTCLPGTPNCQSNGGTWGILTGWPTTAGYDMASGLGSVNAANLVTAWGNAVSSFKASTTSLAFTPATISITHGQPVSLNITVSSDSGTPTGNVSLGAVSSTTGAITQQIPLNSYTLADGMLATTTSSLPGGTYGVVAHYPGDGVFALSNSSPVNVTVASEPSVVNLILLNQYYATFTSIPYGSEVQLNALVAGASGNGIPTGTVSFLDNGATLASSSPLDQRGWTEVVGGTTLLAAGSHSVVASYSGDPSFQAGTSAPTAFTVTKAVPGTTVIPSSANISAGNSVTLTATVTVTSQGLPPSGMIAFYSGTQAIGAAVPVTSATSATAGTLAVTASLATSTLAVGSDSITAVYSGDTNYASSTSPATTVDVIVLATVAIAPATITIAAPGGSGSTTVTFTGSPEFSGTFALSPSICSNLPTLSTCSFSASSVSLSPSQTTAAVTLTIATTGTGANSARAIMPGHRSWMALALLLPLAFWGRRRRAGLCCLLLALTLGIPGCGGSSSTNLQQVGTPAGTYKVTLTITGGGVTLAPPTLTVVVQ
jgi:hypothetical protein